MKYLSFVILVCITMQTTAQKIYKVGDKIPDFKIKITNRKAEANIADFYEGKVLLLDFWGIHCEPCVKGLPKLDSLRTLFQGKLEVIAINGDFVKTPEKVQEYLNRNEKLRNIKMPFAVNDGTIKRYFTGGDQLPADIWIDAQGYIRAGTSGDAVTYETVKKFVNEGIAPIEYSLDMIKIDELNGPFPSGDTGFLFRSILEKANINVPIRRVMRGLSVDPQNINKTKRIYYSGATIRDLFFTAAFGEDIPFSQAGRFVLNANDSLRYLRPEEAKESYVKANYRTRIDWEMENTYIYELILPELRDKKLVLNEYMLNDLNRYFDVTGSIEMREMPCYLIVNKTEESKTIKTSGGKSTWQVDSVSGGRTLDWITGIKNKSMNEIADKLSSISYGLPFVNGTVNSQNIDMIVTPAVPGFWTHIDIETLRQAFNKYGFNIIEGKGKIKTVVITHKPSSK